MQLCSRSQLFITLKHVLKIQPGLRSEFKHSYMSNASGNRHAIITARILMIISTPQSSSEAALWPALCTNNRSHIVQEYNYETMQIFEQLHKMILLILINKTYPLILQHAIDPKLTPQALHSLIQRAYNFSMPRFNTATKSPGIISLHWNNLICQMGIKNETSLLMKMNEQMHTSQSRNSTMNKVNWEFQNQDEFSTSAMDYFFCLFLRII